VLILDRTPHPLDCLFGSIDLGPFYRDNVPVHRRLLGLRQHDKFQTKWFLGHESADQFSVEQQLLRRLIDLALAPT
jgi:hypothetical protein